MLHLYRIFRISSYNPEATSSSGGSAMKSSAMSDLVAVRSLEPSCASWLCNCTFCFSSDLKPLGVGSKPLMRSDLAQAHVSVSDRSRWDLDLPIIRDPNLHAKVFSDQCRWDLNRFLV